MKVEQDEIMRQAVRTLTKGDQRKAAKWARALEYWDTDEVIREMTTPSRAEGVLALTTPDDLQLFFTLDAENSVITLTNILKPSRFRHWLAAVE